MKLIQANIWGGRLEPQILQFFKEQNPDFVCLQVAIDLAGGRSAMFATTKEVKQAAGLEYMFMSPVFTLNYMKRKADFGNCIISRFPIINKQTIFTGHEYVRDFDFLDSDANMRNLQLADIELPGKQILHVLNHYGHHIKQHKNGDEETMRQCQLIADNIKKLTGKTILTGDFNLAPHSESIEIINQLLLNLSIEKRLKTTRTSLTHKTEVCDYIFVSDEVKVNAFDTSKEIISDHQALVMEFV